MSEGEIRSFIAIELTEEIKRELSSIKKQLTAQNYNFLRWVSTEGIHLTLKFLGNIKVSQIDRILKEIGEVCKKERSFTLEIGGLGVFPNLRKPRVLWVGVGGDIDNLLKIQREIDDRLNKLGYPAEKRSFSPHITLARVKESIKIEDIENFETVLKETSFQSKYFLYVNSISLMKSVLYPTGAVYSKIANVQLID